MKRRQMISQLVTVAVAALLLLAAYTYIVGDGSIFKGKMDGDTIKAKVIRVTDVKTANVSGENEIITVTFKAKALNTELRGKTLDVIQEIDRSYAFSPVRWSKTTPC